MYTGLRLTLNDINDDYTYSQLADELDKWLRTNDYKYIGFFELGKISKQPHIHVIIHDVDNNNLRKKLKRYVLEGIPSTQFAGKNYTNYKQGYIYCAKNQNVFLHNYYTVEEIEYALEMGKQYKESHATNKGSTSYISELLGIYEAINVPVNSHLNAQRIYKHIHDFLNTKFSKQHNEYIRNQYFYGILQAKYNKLYRIITEQWYQRRVDEDLKNIHWGNSSLSHPPNPAGGGVKQSLIPPATATFDDIFNAPSILE